MKKVAFFDTKPYDRTWFDALGKNYEITYFEEKLNHHTAKFTDGFDAVCAFVNDRVNALAIERLYNNGVQLIAMRCAGYSNVDVKAAFQKLHIVRVPAYSPHAVAEHTMGLLLTLNRRLHKAYNRTREFNFSIVGLTGTDLYGKTVGVIGTGKIGRTFIDICRGFGMRVLAYDKFPAKDSGLDYVELDTLLRESDVISLHCPLTPETHHMIDADAIKMMRDSAILVNTSRGGLIDTHALIDALRQRKFAGVGLDVYETEDNQIFEDYSDDVLRSVVVPVLLSFPNVVITSHQAFFTRTALQSIAITTMENARAFARGEKLVNLVE